MLFKQFNPEDMEAMFRPHLTLFGYQIRYQPERFWANRYDRFNNVVDMLKAAFGEPVQIHGWDEVCPMRITGKKPTKKATAENSWYVRYETGYEEIYLTKESQMSFLILASQDIEIMPEDITCQKV